MPGKPYVDSSHEESLMPFHLSSPHCWKKYIIMITTWIVINHKTTVYKVSITSFNIHISNTTLLPRASF